MPTVTVTAHRDPVDKSYRRMISGMDLFERQRAMAPGASLRFRLLPRKSDTDMNRLSLEIAGESVAVPVRVERDHSFTLERIQKALDEDASVRSNRRAQTMTWRAEIRTPGVPPNTRRLGDLRLECAVGIEAGLVSNERSRSGGGLADLIFGRRNTSADYCNREKPQYLFFAERPLYSVTLVSGARTETLLFDMLYADARKPEQLKEELPYCDCEVLLDRTYFLPLGDRSWPDDTLVRFEYMDDQPATTAVAPAMPSTAAGRSAQNAVVLGRSTKAEVVAALGRSTAISFDNGFEVWAYWVKDPPRKVPEPRPGEPPVVLTVPPEDELVILFSPSGIATKARLLPLPPQA